MKLLLIVFICLMLCGCGINEAIKERTIVSAQWGYIIGYEKAFTDYANYKEHNTPFPNQEERDEYFNEKYKELWDKIKEAK